MTLAPFIAGGCTAGPPEALAPRRVGPGAPTDSDAHICSDADGPPWAVVDESSTVAFNIDSCDGQAQTTTTYGWVTIGEGVNNTPLSARFTHVLTPTWEGNACLIDVRQTTETLKLDEYVPAGAYPAHVYLCRATAVARFPDQFDEVRLLHIEVGAEENLVPLEPLESPLSLPVQADAPHPFCDLAGPHADVREFAYSYRATLSVPSASVEAFSRAGTVLYLDFLTLPYGEMSEQGANP